ncbi:50S ribosomal protein L35, partial [Dysosmobacter welbionis]
GPRLHVCGPPSSVAGECAVPGVHRRLGLRPVPHLLSESHQAPERKPAVGELDVADEEQPPECQGPP